MEHFDWEEKVDQWIDNHKEELISDIVKLVKIKSVADPNSDVKPYGSGCLKALHTMLEMGNQYGFQTENYENYMGCIDMGQNGETIGFWGHLDVVPEGDNWDYPPYEGIVKDGLIIGRGAQDNKGQTVAVLYVMRCIRELGIPLRHNLKLFVGTDEERGMSDINYYLSHYSPPPFSIIADSNFPVCYGEKGILTLKLISNLPLSNVISKIQGGVASNVVPDKSYAILKESSVCESALARLQESVNVQLNDGEILLTSKGIAGHTAFPEHAVNAIYVLTKALEQSGALDKSDQEILSFVNKINKDCWGTGLNAACEDQDSGRMTCVGSMIDLTEDHHLCLTINIRYPVTGDAKWILEQVHQSCVSHGYTEIAEKIDAAHYFPPEHPIVPILTDTYNSVMNDDKRPFVLPGGTYARKLPCSISYGMGVTGDLSKVTDTKLDCFRPGHGGAHGPDECTIIDLLLKSIKIFVLGIARIDSFCFQDNINLHKK